LTVVYIWGKAVKTLCHINSFKKILLNKFSSCLIARFVDFLVTIKLYISVLRTDKNRSIKTILEDFDIWNDTFRDIGNAENSTHPKSVTIVLSSRRALIDPYNGILHFYLSLASITIKNGFPMQLVCYGRKRETIKLRKNFTLEVVPAFLNLIYAFRPQKRVWQHELHSISKKHSKCIVVGPTVEIEQNLVSSKDNYVVATIHTDWILDPKNVGLLRVSRFEWLKDYYASYKPDLWVSNTLEVLNDLSTYGVVLKARVLHHVPQSFTTAKKRNLVLFAGKIDSRKNPLELARSWAQISQYVPDWSLTFIGPLGSVGKIFLSELKKLQNVEYLGPVSPQIKNKLMSESKIVVVPSTYESFGYAGSEALHSGAIVLARDIPTIRESLNGQGYFFSTPDELSEKLRYLIENYSQLPKSRSTPAHREYFNNWSAVFDAGSIRLENEF
jgi:glycosyltransferase involved in cell wall biosynthesis